MTDDALEPGDDEDNPTLEPKSAQPWLDRLEESEKAFADWNRKADGIDKLYADLGRLASDTRDREFQLFWANIQVLGPSIYARKPVPVVVAKFKDRKPVVTKASELLERCSVVSFDLADINSVMLLLRDDLTIVGRGSPWVRYEAKGKGYGTERVCIDFKDRRDFLHEPSRHWMEVGWVAAASYQSRKEMRKRFSKASGKAYQEAEYSVQKEDRDNGAADNRKKAKVWEIWSKTDDKVIWVAEGCKTILDEGEPHLKLEGFFPCPKPVYATVQRRSLIPVPDMVYYKDQLEEINQLTNRIHALTDALKVRGFYPAGGEIGDAVETAMKLTDDRQIMVPVSAFVAFDKSGSAIVWLPIDMIATTLQGLVELRRQVIDDVYQIMGLSDIMRGSTDPTETAAAQDLKAQYGSVRVRDKQSELVRIARDLVQIGAEIMAENFSPETLLEMSQLDIPSDKDIKKEIEQLTAKAEEQYQGAEQKVQATLQEVQQQNPQGAQEAGMQAEQQLHQLNQQIIQQAQAAIAKLNETPTIEKVMALLRDQKIRPFVLDIETDSTIAPDEKAEKQSRTEFVTALGALLTQFGPLVQQVPAAAPVMGEVLKFALAPYRAGRELEGKIEEAVDQLAKMAQQPKPNPEAEKLEKEYALREKESAAKLAGEAQKTEAEMAAHQQETQARLAQIAAQTEQDRVRGEKEIELLTVKMTAAREELQIKRESAQIDAAAKVQAAEINAASAEQTAAIREEQAARSAERNAAAFEQKSALADRQAALKGLTP